MMVGSSKSLTPTVEEPFYMGYRGSLKREEVSFLYRFISGISLHELNGSTSFVHVKNRLIFVITVFSNGVKSPLTIIGNSKRPRIFLLRMDTSRDFGLLFYAQTNYCAQNSFGRLWSVALTKFDSYTGGIWDS